MKKIVVLCTFLLTFTTSASAMKLIEKVLNKMRKKHDEEKTEEMKKRLKEDFSHKSHKTNADNLSDDNKPSNTIHTQLKVELLKRKIKEYEKKNNLNSNE